MDALPADALPLDGLPTDDQEFRLHVRAWLEANFPHELRFPTRRLDFRQSLDWHRKLAAKGWVAPGWPREYGGMGLDANKLLIFMDVCESHGVGRTPDQGMTMVGPLLIQHGSAEQKAYYLPRILTGEHIWCQGYSEPGAGSDLASLQTKAERDGDEWIITGQKVWTSGAHYSDIGEIICRTDPDLPKHKGLTGFVVDMKAPGVEVRPLRQMTGGANFNEVFFTEVRVPDTHRLGDVNQGWSVALTTLMNERASIGAGGAGSGMGIAGVTRLAELLRHFGLLDDAVLRQELMEVYIGYQVAKYTNQRAMDKIKKGELPGPEMSIAKLSLTNNLWRTANFVAHALGPRMIADGGEWGTYAWGQLLLGVPGMKVAGGTDEVMKNIISERVLGLPKEPGIDTTSPFRDLKVGTQAN